eukprot:GDKH01008218.1.p1 GENE.GDKH01008218.1~~GDKH01008218.1.p1  ORF type:complete len:92 (-),score=19.98 GDKH01008218.1:79-354(-)
MIDQGENDDKVICVHLDDPEYRDFKCISELPAHRLKEIRRFFEDYKKNENKEVVVGEDAFKGPEEAMKIVQDGMDRYEREIKATQKFLRLR